MSKSDDDRPDVNTGNEWFEMDLFDLANSVRLQNPIEEIAGFLCRSRREVREKIVITNRSCRASRLETRLFRGIFQPALGQMPRQEASSRDFCTFFVLGYEIKFL